MKLFLINFCSFFSFSRPSLFGFRPTSNVHHQHLHYKQQQIITTTISGSTSSYSGRIRTRATMDVKGLTLRSKASRRRPKISAPQPIASHNSAAPVAAGRTPEARHHAQPSDATADLVKRRYSAKFNTLPGIDSEAPPVPSLPGEPIEHFAADREPTGDAQPIRVDVNALRNPNLPIESCKYK